MNLDLSDFNIVCSFLGILLTVYGFLAFGIREKCFLPDALIAFLLGILLGPVLQLITPLKLAQNEPQNIDRITAAFSRLVLGVQLVIAGIQLPSRFLKLQRWPLAVLLLPGLTGMWFISSLLIWWLLPPVSFLHALAIGACVSPTDPVLSSAIVHGAFADQYIPAPLRHLIVAESGANDGLGYPFLFLPLFLLNESTGQALFRWVAETLGYVVILSVIYGVVMGTVAQYSLRWFESRGELDRESFTILVISLSLLVLGTCGLVNSDDILACFVTGNFFTWDDWFRIQTHEDTLQPTVDLGLNLAIFFWIGAACPWSLFVSSPHISFPRLLLLAILILLARRLPVILLLRRWIPAIETLNDALFMGFFGPIGVSAIFYCCLGLEYLAQEGGEATAGLATSMRVVVWFLVAGSILVHGLSIPIAMLGRRLMRWMRPGKEEREPLLSGHL